MNKKIKKEIGEICGAMTDLEVKIAQYSYYTGFADGTKQAEWVCELSKLSGRLDKVWKAEVK